MELSTGVRLDLAEAGDPGGVPVLMLHGLTDSWRSFAPMLPMLPPEVRAIAVTQRGHGDASRPPEGYRGEDFAADAVALLDAMGIERAIIVGHSLGAWVAGHVVRAYPQRVSGLVLLGAIASPGANPVLQEFASEAVAPLRDPVDAGFVREFQLGTTARPLAPGMLDLFVGESLKVPARVWRDAFGALMKDDLVTLLAGVAAPTLLIWGDRDAYASRDDQERILAVAPGARLSVHEGCGHAVHWEEPAAVAAEVAAFAV
ncbi:alpha/beta hydrolase [Paractinoplanes deccanensis]|uniref:Alpha/beta hydrolase n=1 Tax=Paractinoplanes deccanensis TaxID=113561 RepID=A0ABQ3YCH6_9ACTN|nr:alpha/beta hydrolase [Actinoplanes deccanensis]GID77722.1 alpha/beta hydrolase [Actinoplanes deccanensis]